MCRIWYIFITSIRIFRRWSTPSIFSTCYLGQERWWWWCLASFSSHGCWYKNLLFSIFLRFIVILIYMRWHRTLLSLSLLLSRTQILYVLIVLFLFRLGTAQSTLFSNAVVISIVFQKNSRDQRLFHFRCLFLTLVNECLFSHHWKLFLSCWLKNYHQ